MKDEWVNYVAGHPLMSICTRLPGCFQFPKCKLNYNFVLKVQLNPIHSGYCFKLHNDMYVYFCKVLVCATYALCAYSLCNSGIKCAVFITGNKRARFVAAVSDI